MTVVHSRLNRSIASVDGMIRGGTDIDGGGATDHLSYVIPTTLEAFQ